MATTRMDITLFVGKLPEQKSRRAATERSGHRRGADSARPVGPSAPRSLVTSN